MPRARRESQWLVLRRCLAIVRRAQRGPAARQDLLQAVFEQEGPDAYGGATDKALRRRLENDLARIRDHLRIDLCYDRRTDGYVMRDTWLPLLELSDPELATVAWLEQTFAPDSPQHDEVHALLGHLRLLLSPQRRAEIERHHTALVVDLAQRDEDRVLPAVWERLTQALTERRRIEFAYLSPQQEDQEPRRHVVDPYERFFDTVRGHYYLRGWCHYTDGPLGRREQGHYFLYRLGRIADLHLLPHKLPPFPPSAPHHRVEYRLNARVARLGVTRHPGIQIQEVEGQPDGSAVVRGTTDDLFWAARTLLHYGPNCRVLGGPELRREMRQVVRQMADMYSGRADSPGQTTEEHDIDWRRGA